VPFCARVATPVLETGGRMTTALEFSAVVVFAAVNVVVCSCLSIAGLTDGRLKESRFPSKVESDETQILNPK